MLKLHANSQAFRDELSEDALLTITEQTAMPDVLKSKYAYFVGKHINPPSGFAAYLVFDGDEIGHIQHKNVFSLPNELRYLSNGDIIRLSPGGRVNVLFRINSNHNTILLTEQCNHYCLMCSQPPKSINDSWLLDEAMELLEIIPRTTENLGFSGGEPTLYGDKFISLITKAKLFLPNTAIDILTNGRAFSNVEFARKFQHIDHPDCVLGIPLYSDDPVRHNYVVQSKNAFDETVRGILNLKQFGQKVEIRIVIHQQTIDRLVKTCEFITRNLLFVDHVALMGLEMMGFTRANLDKLWIDPFDYKDVLSEAVSVLDDYGITNSVYNHQLCVVNPDISRSYVKSISDWKNEYVQECDGCVRKSQCGGFFSSSKQHRYSDHISPFKA